MREGEFEGRKQYLMSWLAFSFIGILLVICTAFSANELWINKVWSLRWSVAAGMVAAPALWAAKVYFIEEQRDPFWPLRILGCWALGIGAALAAIGLTAIYRAVF